MNKYSIIYNNLNSYDNFNLSIVSRPSIPVAERNINLIEVPGRNGTLTEDLCTYKDIEIPISFNLIDSDNINDSARLIKSWLIGDIIDKKLILSDDTDYCYKVKKVIIDKEIERKLKVFGRFTAVFTCEPFLFEVNNSIITLTKNEFINNPSGFPSEPSIKIYGSGTIDLIVNTTTTHLENVDGYVVVDTALQDCYKDDALMNNYMSGYFPTLQSAKNDIGWTGNVTKIEITPNWRWL